jgi:streptomycin 3"-adenylyltransferase
MLCENSKKRFPFDEGEINMQARVQKILEEIKQLSLETFDENLVGVYIHGSLALGCFKWNNSDIDFIVVLKNTPTQSRKETYISELLKINQDCPPKGLEMSVVLEENTRNFVYPTQFELHFSNAHFQRCSENVRDYCQHMNGVDKDLAAHFTIIKNACIVLCGNPVKDTFGEVPEVFYYDSIKFDIENAEEDIRENPVYVILNLCRVLAYKSDGLVLSKEDGGHWGMAHVDAQYLKIIEKALNSYQSSSPFQSEIYQELSFAFAKYMHDRIFTK